MVEGKVPASAGAIGCSLAVDQSLCGSMQVLRSLENTGAGNVH